MKIATLMASLAVAWTAAMTAVAAADTPASLYEAEQGRRYLEMVAKAIDGLQ